MSKIIGVTGGIGSGKTLVCRVLAVLGLKIYNADERAKWLITNHLSLKNSIIALLGSDAYLPDGSYNRQWVAQQVFTDKEKLNRLNALVHPCVYEDTALWIKANENDAILVKEAALLTKTTGTPLDCLVVVHTPMSLRLQRIATRDPKRSIDEIQKIIDNQMPDQKRIEMADIVIYNDEKQLLLPQIMRLITT